MENNINIPVWPTADEREENAIIRVLHSGSWWRNGGSEVKQFENEFAAYQNCKYGVSLANGTVAIEIALKALGIKRGDEVIVPDFTFYSTVSAVLSVGAIPVLVDVSEDTFCIEPEKVENAITDKTKAIIVVHIAGNIAEIDSLVDIAQKNNLYLIEDSSHAQGAEYNGKRAGSFGDVGTFSFQNAKLITSGEGGITICNSEELRQRMFLNTNCGREEGDTNYNHVLIGTNARLSEIQGAVLRVELEKFDDQVQLREKNYKYLEKLLTEIKGIKMQKSDKHMTRHPHYMVMFYYDKKYFNNVSRDDFVAYLTKCGLPVNRAYKALHEIPFFENLSKEEWRIDKSSDECRNSKMIADNVICIAHNVLLGDEELMDYIADCIKNVKDEKG